MKRAIRWVSLLSMRWLSLLSMAALLSLTIMPEVLTGAGASAGGQMSSEPGVYLTPYRTATAPPKAVAEFDHFTLKELPDQEGKEIAIDSEGNVPISGRLSTTNGVVYAFKTAKLIKGAHGYAQLTFTTEQINGVSYNFTGTYLEHGEKKQGQYITLKGVLARYQDGRKVARASLGFYQWISA